MSGRGQDPHPLPASTIPDIIERSAESHRDRPAIVRIDGSIAYSYRDLLLRCQEVSGLLIEAGTQRDDVVLVSHTTAAEMLVGVLGSMYVAACAPLNPAYTAREIAGHFEALAPSAVIVDSDQSDLASVAQAHGTVVVVLDPHVRSPGHAAIGPFPEATAADRALILHTAGTTASPKQVPLSHGNLAAAAGSVVTSLALAPTDRCLNVMPLFHSHGLLGAALSTLRAGASIVCADRMDPRRFLTWGNDTEATWYTAAATIHQLVVDAPGEWPGLRFMRSASAPLAPQIAQRLEDRFGAPMIEVYGMTEAYQIAANPIPPGERRLGTVGVPTGTEIAIADQTGTHLPQGQEGEVLVRGPAVFAGYAAPPGANDDAFFGSWFRTGDIGRVDEDGYLTITGRWKEQINRGGEKIAPREVDEALLEHPAIEEAMAFGFPDPLLGQELGAAVVVREGERLDTSAVRAFLEGRVAPFKVPRKILVLDELPKSATGKLQRIEFASVHLDDLTGTRRAQFPTDRHAPTIERLAALWQELLGCEHPPVADDHFFRLGGTSVLTMELVARIEMDFGVDLPVIDVVGLPTLRELADRIDDDEPGHQPLLRSYRATTKESHLILVPGQMGMAVGLNLIADGVTEDVNVHLFDYPGHQPGEDPRSTIEELAEVLVDEIHRAGLRGKIALYGNSLGGWVVFEAARTLAAMQRRPTFVGIGDLFSPVFNLRSSPHRPGPATRIRNRAKRLRKSVAGRIRSNSTSPDESVAVARRARVLRASGAARRSYRPHAYDGDVVVFATPERCDKYGPALGWDLHASGPIRPVRVPGQHSTMHREDAPLIAATIDDELRRAGDTAHDNGLAP